MAKVKCSPGDLGISIEDILEEYSEEVAKNMPDIVQQVTKDTVKDLKSRATKLFGGKGKKAYAKSFKSKKVVGTSAKTTYRIYSTQYQLAHLLEHGHAIKNQTGRIYGKTQARPHWGPAEEKAIKDLEDKISEKL